MDFRDVSRKRKATLSSLCAEPIRRQSDLIQYEYRARLSFEHFVPSSCWQGSHSPTVDRECQPSMQYPATAFLACSALLGVALAGPHGYNKRPEHPSDSAWSSNADKTIKSLSQQTQRPSTKNRAVVNSADAAPSETEDLSLGLDDDGNPTSAWTPVVPEKTTKKTTSTKVTTSKSTPAPQPTKSTSSPSKTTTPASQPTKSQGGTAPPAGYGDHGKPSSSTSCKTGSTCRPTTKTVKSTITTPVEAISTWTSWEDQTITTSVITTFLSTKYVSTPAHQNRLLHS